MILLAFFFSKKVLDIPDQSDMILSINETGEIPERSKGADCKSVGSAFEGSNPSLPTNQLKFF